MTHKNEVVSAAENLLAAARLLPEEPLLTTTEEVVAALKRYDVAENRLDDAIDAYMREGRK